MTSSIIDGRAFVEKYKGIIEVYPRKASNFYAFEEKLRRLAETHEIVKMSDGWMRAFEKIIAQTE